MAASFAQFLAASEDPVDVQECVVTFDDEDIREGVENCSKSLIGKLPSVGTLETALQAIWRQPEGFHVLHHGGNIFQFFFSNETKNLAEKVGSSLGKVLDADFFRFRGGDERILKVKILLYVTMPLRRNLKISGSNGRIYNLQLKYERIGTSVIIVALLDMKSEAAIST
ncbi:hypothetical protein PIB30_049748 [Stylosanthes scabra]|uniref:Uncharacterized protein n=1 Tax=Stylosanthes scabra TaxID=79078 RepID=A0ABU6VIH3_9FABA|nr:hypothetical protein [Stylosanthes scabra]